MYLYVMVVFLHREQRLLILYLCMTCKENVLVSMAFVRGLLTLHARVIVQHIQFNF